MKTKYKNINEFNIKGCTLISRCESTIKSGIKVNFWKCSCECGNSFDKREDLIRRLLKSDDVVTCSSCSRKRASKKCILEDNEGVKKRVFRAYKYGAKSRNIHFELSELEVGVLVTQDCFYCGQAPYEHADKNYTDEPFLRTGIDRVDNDLGYTLTNTVSCCEICNRMKLMLSHEKFINHLYKIIKKQETFNDQSANSYTQVSGNRNHLEIDVDMV